MNFQDWMEKVDAHLEAMCGLDSMCLPDCDYWNNWDAGCSPKNMAKVAIQEAGGF